MCERGYDMEIKRNTEKIKDYVKNLEQKIKDRLKNQNFDISKIKALETINRSEFVQKIKQSKHRKAITYGGAGALVLTLIFSFNLALNASMLAYEISVDDKVIAIVRDEEQFVKAVELLKEEVWNEYNQEFALPENINHEMIKAKNSKLTKPEVIVKNLKEQLDFKVKAVAIVVNGQEVAIVNNERIAEAVLDEIKAPYIKEDGVYKSVNFTQSVDIKEVAVDIASIRDKGDAISFILNGTDEEQVHEVQSGENSWVIAKKYNISVDDILKANPNIRADKLQIGQEISLVVPKPYITVLTKEYVELVETIPFETETVKSESLYKGDKKITVQGVEGKREVKGYIVRENGVEINREVLQQNILSQPKTRVVAEGTKPRPATVASGSFANPTRGRLTSRFGMRYGSQHTGIDIAAPSGTSISAADAGRVSFAGWSGSYGNLIIVDHENGYQTYYAHCNSLLVGVGTRVFKGQQIATIGSTGRSTGPHLHFEVRRNGVPINPSQFVRY